MALIRSREALVGCRTQLVNHLLGERSNPSEPAYQEGWARSFHKNAA